MSELPSLRILYGASADLALRPAREAGFSHLLIRHPGEGVAEGERWLPLAVGADLASRAAAAREAGLGLLLDLTLDRIAARAPLAGDAPFAGPDPAVALDPRREYDAKAALARLGTIEDAAALGAWWAERLARWHGQGVSGFRLLGLEAVRPEWLPSLLAPMRKATPGALLLAWAPGLSPAQIAALSGLGLDGVFGSLPWWDFSALWFWQEWQRLEAIAPVLQAAETVAGPAPEPVRWRQAASLAAFGAAGWLSARAGAEAGTINERLAPYAAPTRPVLPAGPGGRHPLALLRGESSGPADLRFARRAALLLINPDQAAPAAPALPLAALSGRFRLTPGEAPLAPGEWRLLTADALPDRGARGAPDVASAAEAAAQPRLAIEAITPAVDGGLFPVKAIAGEVLRVEADIVFDGHEQIAAALRHRGPGSLAWREVRMRPLGNDRWTAEFPLGALGRHEFTVLAWHDRFATWRDEVQKKAAAGVDTSLELREGEALLRAAAARDRGKAGRAIAEHLKTLEKLETEARRAAMLDEHLRALMDETDDRPHRVESHAVPVEAERIGARFASWYEVFPRSLSDDPARHGNFRDVIRHLPRIRAMGFDVLYFPPIHPIGRINRKGPNNTLNPAPGDPGSPYAIGAAEGGHDALHPELGSFEDFAELRREAARHGLEIALDFAVQCSPDHPWLREHKGWFDWRPDGTIKYAENPPKKYQDIVNVDFYAKDAVPGLWRALCDIVLFWCGHGVRLFRVDNPHTKPFPFWEWMIAEVRARHPDAIFLAEAFTRPKIMYRLAKIGFSQSYTYFTWRNSKSELTDYLQELTEAPVRDFFRPHFFVNTPDINPIFLQYSGRSGFLIRAALAATLSGLWGVYNGFELCEAQALEGREEYRDSEKFQLRAWDWDRPGNIVREVAALNEARRLNPALQTHLGLTFLNAYNDAVLAYEKATPDRSNVVLALVSVDPRNPQPVDFEIPLWLWHLPDDASAVAEDLMSGERLVWRGKMQRTTLTPERPFALWRVRPEI